MAKPRKLPDVNPRDRDGEEIKKRLQNAANELPSLNTPAQPNPDKKRVKRSLSMPDYVWELLWEASKDKREPQGVVVMRGLKSMGFQIDDDDLRDARKPR